MSATKRAWLELMRLSNLPTVLSGAFVISLGGFLRMVTFVDLVMILIAMSCFYAAGFIFNDVFDRRIDADERPHRPIPSGRIGTHAAVQIGVLLIFVGLLLVAAVDQVFYGPDSPRGIPGGLAAAVLLVICMLLYNRFHAASSWTVFLMAACRALVYVTCILVALDTPEQYELFFTYFFVGEAYAPRIWYILAIFLYIAGFSRIARGEVAPRSRGIHYCYHCGYQIEEKGSAQCPECGGMLEKDKLARSTRPLINRNLEWACLAATFAPLLVLMVFLFLQMLSLRMAAVANPAYASLLNFSYYAQTFIFVLLFVLIGCWFVLATIRYRRDRTNPGRSILMWLAGISLIDGLLAYELGLPWWSTAICFGLFFITIWGHRRIAGT